MSDTVPESYTPQTCETLAFYLEKKLPKEIILGGSAKDWNISEVGDGNLNLVFIVEGQLKSIIVKQALPYVRAAGEGWPLSLKRAFFEYSVLEIEAKYATNKLVPNLYFYDPSMAIFAMDYLQPHVILRKELILGKIFQNLSTDIGIFLAKTLFHTSDLGMDGKSKKELVSKFSLNDELCKITEDLIFTEPYYDAKRNNWTSPYLDNDVHDIWQDMEMIKVAMEYKFKFMTESQALLHGDLHSGSIMVTDLDTKVIDPEFGFMGPMAFDIGNYMGNLFFAYFARPGLSANKSNNLIFQEWIIAQMQITWDTFETHFKELWSNKSVGDAFPNEIYSSDRGKVLLLDSQNKFMSTLFNDSLVNAGLEMNRRIIGFAGVADFEEITDIKVRAECERKTLKLARELIVNSQKFKCFDSIKQIINNL